MWRWPRFALPEASSEVSGATVRKQEGAENFLLERQRDTHPTHAGVKTCGYTMPDARHCGGLCGPSLYAREGRASARRSVDFGPVLRGAVKTSTTLCKRVTRSLAIWRT